MVVNEPNRIPRAQPEGRGLFIQATYGLSLSLSLSLSSALVHSPIPPSLPHSSCMVHNQHSTLAIRVELLYPPIASLANTIHVIYTEEVI